MKKFVTLLLASIIIGLVCFGIFHWIFSVNFPDSVNYGFIAALAGPVGEYMRPWFEKLGKEQEEAISGRVKRNLKSRR